ncbi:MAG: PspC domain-containing protein [Gammaproteobacteria bacterium]|nr:PspC domain-containing protein [Gammaproteobacteria bacterium]
MNTYSETAGRRLYRDADRAVLGGVCAGLAGYFGLNLKVTRFLAFITFLMAMPVAVIGYLAGVFLIPSESRRDYDTVIETRCCWGLGRTRRSAQSRTAKESQAQRDRRAAAASAVPSASDIRERYKTMDKRLAELEKQVTSPRFQLEQEFRKL